MTKIVSPQSLRSKSYGSKSLKPKISAPKSRRAQCSFQSSKDAGIRGDSGRPSRTKREDKASSPLTSSFEGDRLAKVMARAGVGSRRQCEIYISQRRIVVNGTVVESPALNVGPEDTIIFDDQLLRRKTAFPRLWLFNKPLGLEVSRKASKAGRKTVFDFLEDQLGYVISVGRLDLNSKGLLLITNHGGLARILELPSTGWVRYYKVRVFGSLRPKALEILRKGVRLEGGETFAPMEITEIHPSKTNNHWLEIRLREGKNREIRRALKAVGLEVNELVRLGYGPFILGSLQSSQFHEIPTQRLKKVFVQTGLQNLFSF